MSLEQLFGGRRVDAAGMAQRLKQVAAELGLPLSPSGMIYNTRLAQEMAKWAETKGKEDEIHRALFHAYFVDSRNIGLADDLADIAVSVGLSGDEARRVLESRAFRSAVDSDWDLAHTLGIRAVPTFIMKGKRLVGFQTYEALAQFVSVVGAAQRDG
jgi:predicted DsbA family dithiol-disulfide isomerase